MSEILIFLIIGFFLALLFLNVYFRVKVLKYYKVLVKNKVEFGSSHIFDKQKMNSEIIPKYPALENDILGFAMHIRKSISIAVILVILITLAGLVLKQM